MEMSGSDGIILLGHYHRNNGCLPAGRRSRHNAPFGLLVTGL